MSDSGILDQLGGPQEAPPKWTALAVLKTIGGLQTQRSPFMPLDVRASQRFYGGKPDALIGGSNCEISNKLILQRRPGVIPYGTVAIPPPIQFYEWQSVAPPNLSLVIDTAPALYNYSPTAAGIYFNKSPLSGQTNVFDLVNTLYAGDGVDLYKIVGQNLLTQSNSFFASPWAEVDATFTTGQTDPFGGTAATQIAFSTTGTAAKVTQVVTPNYSPVASNTFTLSLYMKAASANTVSLRIEDQSGNTIVDTPQVLTNSFARYQVTGTALSSATSLKIYIYNPTTTNNIIVYNSQLEIGGPATPTVITTTKPLGVFLWGIQAPTTAPSFTLQAPSASNTWQPDIVYSESLARTLTSVAANGVYTGTIVNGGSNGLAGRYFKITGFTNAANNSVAPGFLCTASSLTTLTLNNPSSVAETHVGQAFVLSSIVDSNGNQEVAYVGGVSGGAQPVWNTVVGGSTPDGAQTLIVQSNSSDFGTNTGTIAFPVNVTASNTIVIFVAARSPGTLSVSDSQTDTLTSAGTPPQVNTTKLYMYYCLAAAGGATTVTFSGGGSENTWIGIVELAAQTATDGYASNSVINSNSTLFTTGSVTTTNAQDILITFASFATRASGQEIGVIPAGFQGIESLPATAITSGGTINIGTAFEALTTTGTTNPLWSITNIAKGNNINIGITAAFKSSISTLVWTNAGTNLTTGLSPLTGYSYYYSFVNTYTGHRSNVSPLTASTGAFIGDKIIVTGAGMQITPSGSAAQDPQVDAIEVYRNTDGGGFWYQVPPSLMASTSGIITVNGVEYLANPGTTTVPGTWFFTDSIPDLQLNTQIYAPIGFLNSPPPAGMNNLEFFAGRLWGAVNNFLYYNTSTDNATLLNVLQNGVPPESWEPTNYIPFPSPIIRTLAMGAGLVVFTTTDIWVVVGQNLTNFTPIKILVGHGIRSYNAVTIDGSTAYVYTSDGEFLLMNPSGASVEVGFPIGDVIEETFVPGSTYLARHVAGSRDNAVYIANGSTGWYRMNPNQLGASMSGEQAAVWSPFATITGGVGAIASIETSPGIKKLLVGQTSTGVVLCRSISTFTDNGTQFTWNATVGSVVLTTPGKVAEVESITTEMIAADSTQVGVGILMDEIAGSFENLPLSVPDPPQLAASVSVLSQRFYLSQGTVPPICRHMQVNISGGLASTQDEFLALTIRGALVPEQNAG